MDLIISFSGRAKGNCDLIAEFISKPEEVRESLKRFLAEGDKR